MTFARRVAMALDVLLGRVAIKNETATCEREHVGAGEVRVKREDYDALQAANIELGVLRGVAATATPDTYRQILQIVEQTVKTK